MDERVLHVAAILGARVFCVMVVAFFLRQDALATSLFWIFAGIIGFAVMFGYDWD